MSGKRLKRPPRRVGSVWVLPRPRRRRGAHTKDNRGRDRLSLFQLRGDYHDIMHFCRIDEHHLVVDRGELVELGFRTVGLISPGNG